MTPPELRLVLATANPDKVLEITSILTAAFERSFERSGITFHLLPRPEGVPEVEETGATLEDNARLKACALLEATGLGAVADDTGLEVSALTGAPGVRSARYAGEHVSYAENTEKLLRELASLPDQGGQRRARFRTIAICRLKHGHELVSEGTCPGTIAPAPRGTGGFGYDAVFVPDQGDGRTFAEMRPEEKHALSHRGRAFRALASALSSDPRAKWLFEGLGGSPP